MSRLPVVGETFGRYRLLEQLGAGGMGVVYAALDQVLNRKVALKVVLPHHAADPEFRSRFAREAETQARLDSAHVVRVYDYGEHDGVLFLCTQLVEGGDLASRVGAGGALAPALAVEVTAQVLDGLEEAHRAGVVHRDVKPANVLLRQQGGGVTALLCDFGIATMAGQALTQAGQVIGSLPWMAPERHYGEDPGPVGDVYSAGCVLFYALTGAAPYTGTDGEVMMGHLEGEVPQLAGRSAFVRKANAVLARSLAKDPAGRYPSAAAMAADLRALAGVTPGEARVGGAETTVLRAAVARPTTGPRATAQLPNRRPAWVPVAVAAAVALLLVAGGLGLRAVLDDEPALAAGATPIEVAGRTIIVQPTRTIGPLDPVRGETEAAGGSGAVDGEFGGATGGDVAAGSGSLIGEGDAAGSAGSGSRSGSGTSVTRAHYAYRCWDSASHLTNDLATCGIPTGRTGAEWMQSAYSGGCYVASPGAPMVESYGCSYARGTFYVMRATDASSAANWLRQRMPEDRIDNDWYTGTVRAGSAYQGTAVINGTRHYRWGAAYAISGGTWLVYVDATSSAGRLDGRNAMDGHYRHINWVRGAPCDQAACEGNG